MIIALASPRVASSLEDGLDKIQRFLSEASAQGAEVVCFPDAYLPGLRGQDFEVLPFEQAEQERVLRTVAQWSRQEGLPVQEIDLDKTTGMLAGRYAPERYEEFKEAGSL